MNFQPILDAPPAVQIHLFSVLPAFILGGLMLVATKGTLIHKWLGRAWIVLMVITAISSFFIHEIRLIGDFSPIHFLSIITLASCYMIVSTARRGNFVAHRSVVLRLYWGGIGVAGAFTLVPGRIMNEVLLGGSAVSGLVALMLAVFCAGIVAIVVRRKLHQPSLAAIATVALGATVLVLGSVSDVRAGPAASEILARSPLWVWPLLGALLLLGWMLSRDRVVSRVRLLVPPVVFVTIGLVSLYQNGPSTAALAMFSLTLFVGTLAGWRLGRKSGSLVQPDGRIFIPGEWISMVIILLIFASRFVAGAAQAINPHMVGTAAIAVPLAAIAGFSIGITLMRAFVQSGIRR